MLPDPVTLVLQRDYFLSFEANSSTLEFHAKGGLVHGLKESRPENLMNPDGSLNDAPAQVTIRKFPHLLLIP